MLRIAHEALTFDDVLLMPGYSEVTAKDVSLVSQLTKTISLNIEKRRLRSTKWDEQQLLMENQRRKTKGLELYADREAWKSANRDKDDDEKVADSEDKNDENEAEGKGKGEPEENIAESDPMLQEAGYILSDQIRIASKSRKKQLLVLRQTEEE